MVNPKPLALTILAAVGMGVIAAFLNASASIPRPELAISSPRDNKAPHDAVIT